jgi:CDP-glucose 4,6-dehydratase
MLDISKAVFELGWKPKLDIYQTVELTADWYKRYANINIYKLCSEQIEKYSNQ